MGLRLLILISLFHAGTVPVLAAEEPPLLEVGAARRGTIESTDPRVSSPALALYSNAEVRGKAFRLRTPDRGVYHIELSSDYFDPYLVLRDEQGRVLTEDDDGWLALYPRLVVGGLPPERTFRVEACALHGETGDFEIRLIAGEPAPMSPEEKFAESLARTQASVEVVKAARGEKHPTVIRRMDELAYCLNLLRRYGEAMDVLDEALALSREVNGAVDLFTGQLYHNRGQLRGTLYDLEGARRDYEQTLEIYWAGHGDDHPETAKVLRSLARIEWESGDYPKCRERMERALAIFRERFGRSVAIAESLYELAVVLETLGSYEEARTLYEEVVGLFLDAYGDQDPRTARAWNHLGLLLKKQGRLDEARSYYERALRVAKARLGRDHPLTVTIRNNRGVLLHESGDLDEAKQELQQILELREERLGSIHAAVSTSRNNLALVLADLGDLERASELLESAVESDRRLLGAAHPSTVLRLSNLARVVARAGDVERAFAIESESLAERRTILERQLPVLSESERFRWAARQHRSLEQLLVLAPSTDGGDETAYREVVYWKGLVSRGLLQDRAWLAAQVEPELLALHEELGRVLGVMSRVFFDPEADPVEQGAKLDALRRRRGELERQLAGRTQRTRAPLEVDVAALRGGLGPADALVDLVRYESDDGEDRVCGFVLRGEGPLVRVELGLMGELREWIWDHLDSIGADRGVRMAGGDDGPDERSVWPKLEPHLEGVERVFVCPEGDLAMLPFGTLPGKKKDTFLIEEYAFVYLQSALDLLPGAKDAEAKEGGALRVGGLDFDNPADSLGDAAADEEADESDEAGAASAPRERAFVRDFLELDGTLREVRTLSRKYRRVSRDPSDLTLLTGSEASEERIKREVVGKRFIHLATHGFFDESAMVSLVEAAREEEAAAAATVRRDAGVAGRTDVLEGLLPGLQSGIVLAAANLSAVSEDSDGMLTAEEVAWLDLRACRLATLSACETGLGKPQAGEHLIGLRRALRLAGARTTVTSLWKVQDEPAETLMTDFYDRLWSKGQGVHEALRGAQLQQLRTNRSGRRGDPRPDTWGAFVLEGAWKWE